MRGPTITIDGPAGAGKSTIAMIVAGRLKFTFLDTGATYRAATWKAIQSGIPLTESERIADLIRDTEIRLDGSKVFVDGQDVSEAIRENEISKAVAPVANAPACREVLVALQREMGKEGGVVTEGRDQGTVVFPDAEFKFWLDASVDERATRRANQLPDADVNDIKAEIEKRDESDRTRPVGPMVKPEGAIVVDTTGLTIEEVVRKIMHHIVRGNKAESGESKE